MEIAENPKKSRLNILICMSCRKVPFYSWYMNELVVSLSSRKSAENLSFLCVGLFQGLVVKDETDINVIKDILQNFTPLFLHSDRGIDIKKVNYYEANTNIRRIDNNEGISFPSIMPSEAELIARCRLPLTINIWRFNEAKLEEIRNYGKHHQSHAINILLMTFDEEDALCEHYIQHSDSSYDVYELEEVPTSVNAFSDYCKNEENNDAIVARKKDNLLVRIIKKFKIN